MRPLAMVCGLLLGDPSVASAFNSQVAKPAIVLGATEEQTPRLDLNEASVAQLIRLPGIGSSRAQAIVEYRSRRPFRRTRDVMRVRGIGRRLYVRLKPMIRVGPAKRRTEKGGARSDP